jgi:hypothetical protein
MANWSLNIEGGFAWIFKGSNPIKKQEVTVGLVRKTRPTDKPHEMTLEVATDAVNEEATTLPSRADGDNTQFILRGHVRFLPDGEEEPQGEIERTLTDNGSGGSNDFFRIFSLSRLTDGRAPKLIDGWPNQLMASFVLRNGDLNVLDLKFDKEFSIKDDDGKGSEVNKRLLASGIQYEPDVDLKRLLKISTDAGDVTLRRGSKPLAIRVIADCTCRHDTPTPGQPLSGFGIIFGLYDNLVPQFRLIPCPQENSSAAGRIEKRSPGPDCPPSDHDAPV